MNVALRTVHRFALLSIAVIAAVTLSGCGGGSNYASGGIVGTGDSGRATQGTITALGNHSIVVGGQTFTLTGAPITINGQTATDAQLMIGMVVTVLNSVHADGSVTVTGVQYNAEVQGVVTGVDPTAQSFTVLGQRVQTDRLTLYVGGAFDTLLNQSVEVSGFRSTPGDLLATLVIVKPPPAKALQVTGAVGTIDTGARTFSIGLQIIDYSGVPPGSVPAGLANNATVRVGGTQSSLVGTLFADSLAIVPTTPPDVVTVEIEGLITEFTGPGSFKVNGQLTDARNSVFEDGTVDMLANGVMVEVEGKLTGGVLAATRVEIEHVTQTEIDGVVAAIDAASSTVTVGGQVIRIADDTQFIDSSSLAVVGFSLALVRIGDRVSILAFRDEEGVIATRLERLNPDAPPPNQPTTSIQGTISNLVSAANFVVAGQQVNAGAAAFIGGTSATLANGVNVAIDGTLANGVLSATTVQFLPGNPVPPTIAVTGTISGFVSIASFTVAGVPVTASSATFSNGGPGDLANGRTVTVSGTVQNGVLVAQTVSLAQPPPMTTLEVEGTISSFVSIASFVVSGQTVNASQAKISNGSTSDLANGRKVQATGVLQNGVLVATSVQIEDAPEAQEVSVEGLVSNFVSVANFVVAGRTIDASHAKFDGGTAGNLANGKKVQVQGVLSGQVVVATELEFED